MNKNLTIALLAAALLAPAVCRAPAAEADQPALNPIQSEMRTIVEGINAKVKEKQGKVTAADLAENIKAFDALLAKHAGEKTDELARVAYMKAMLYAQLLHDQATADRLLQQMKSEYKGTKFIEMYAKQEAARAESEKAQAALAPGKPFPDFSEKDLASQPLSVGKFKGKVVLVDFWATWCGPCVHELPNVIEAYKKYHGQGFEIVGISLDSSREKLDAFLKEHDGMTWPQYFDGKGWGNKVAGRYGVQSIPFTVLVGADGKIIGKDLRGEALGEAVGQALKK